MSAAQATGERLGRRLSSLGRRFAPEAPLLPGLVVVALMLVWAVHNGGYDEDTWYWGALVMLALLAATVGVDPGPSQCRAGRSRLRRSPVRRLVATCRSPWAQAPGAALEGANRALLYLLVFAVMLVVPWTRGAALVALLAFAIGIGVIGDRAAVQAGLCRPRRALVIGGRLAAPTGYFNATAALFMMASLPSIVLALPSGAARPGARAADRVRDCARLQLAVTVQSRGWLFTLPLVAIAAIASSPTGSASSRPRCCRWSAALVARAPAAGTSIDDGLGDRAQPAAHRARQRGAGDVRGRVLRGHARRLGERPARSAPCRARAGGALGATPRRSPWPRSARPALVATPRASGRYISAPVERLQPPGDVVATGSHFADVGSGRYDFWRVALERSWPIRSVGSDRTTSPTTTSRAAGPTRSRLWPHSLELAC